MVYIPGSQTVSDETHRFGQDVKSTFSRGGDQSHQDDGVQKHYGDSDQSYENTHKNFEGEHYQQPDFYSSGVQQGRSVQGQGQETAQSRYGQQHPHDETINAGGGGPTYGAITDHTSFAGQPAEQREQSQKSYRQPRYQTHGQPEEPSSAHPQPQQSYAGQQRPQYGDEGQRSFNDAQRDVQQGARKKSFMGRVHDKLASI
ncbi:hypothetical protein AAP_03765 [Ascosphaera apis ARSEF 7405]|uniref:Uncharacterized protein n=1 Tax=Ascosphaera apis ARSEF 7405 TaxID=392613 RepID=A0A166NKV0_9EURO|nr:hypothetical protein AAP_03765 [Ascosphaera apis ARSEF 7405]